MLIYGHHKRSIGGPFTEKLSRHRHEVRLSDSGCWIEAPLVRTPNMKCWPESLDPNRYKL